MPYLKPHVPDFDRIARTVRGVGRAVLRESVEGFAGHARDSFVERIEGQDFRAFEAVPLSPEYLAWKERNRLDPRTMIATAHYKGQVRVFKRETAAGVEARVGFHPNAKARDKDGHTLPITLDLLAKVHEFGSSAASVPARRHWGEHRDRLSTEAKGVRQSIGAGIVSRLKAKGIKVGE